MKRLIALLGLSSIILVIVSLFFIIFSFATLNNLNFTTHFSDAVNHTYSGVAAYSGLYKFTFVVCAFWVTIKQLYISQSNYNTTLQQVNFVQGDILAKRKKDSATDTLNNCTLFLTEMQMSFKELIDTRLLSGMPLDWGLLGTFTNESLKRKYPPLFEKMQQIDGKVKSQILLTLYQLEAFSSIILSGNLDKKLAKEIIGYTFIKQIGFLLGPISYFREDINTPFGKNTIRLYEEWHENPSDLFG